MSRAYTCPGCLRTLVVHTSRGPLPKACPECKALDVPPAAPLFPSRPPELPPPVALVRDPFNSTPDTAPVDVPRETAPGIDISPGLLTRQITAELGTMRSSSPMAETLKAAAILVAQAADAVPVDDLKQKLTAIKELRSIIADLAKTNAGEEEDESDGPFGSSAPTVQHSQTA
jgi:hypothetical protein